MTMHGNAMGERLASQRREKLQGSTKSQVPNNAPFSFEAGIFLEPEAYCIIVTQADFRFVDTRE